MSGLSTERMEFSSSIRFVANKPLPASVVNFDVTLLFSMYWLKGAILENGNRTENVPGGLQMRWEEETSKKKMWW